MRTTETLHIRLFGELDIKLGSRQLSRLPTQKSAGLFANLVMHAGHVILRERLADTFWRDMPTTNARRCLRTDIWRIRKLLSPIESGTEHYLIVKKNGVGFNQNANYKTDVDIFKSRMRPLLVKSADELTLQDYVSLEECVSIYRGDLLETNSLEWCVLHRQELKSQYMHAIELLMARSEILHNWDSAIAYGQKLLLMDALLEHVHFSLMRCFNEKGDRSAAIRQYQHLRHLLRNDLGISPIAEIENLYQSIITRGSRHDPQISLASISQPQPIQISTRDCINGALRDIKSAERLLTEAIKRMKPS